MEIDTFTGKKLMTMTLHVTVDLDTNEQKLLQAQAQQQGLTLEGYIQAVIARLARCPDQVTFQTLPREERNRLLALQAEDAAPLYSADLPRPLAERELTAFTSLEGEPVFESVP